MEPISIMLVDDNPVFLRATTQFLEAHDGVIVIGTATQGDEALKQIENLRPHTVLIDLAMPGLSGLATIPRLRHLMPEVGIIALTVMNSEGFRQAALTAGVACSGGFRNTDRSIPKEPALPRVRPTR